jgi:hypothetical protein
LSWKLLNVSEVLIFLCFDVNYVCVSQLINLYLYARISHPLAMVSGTFQALQSYKLEDIHFGGRFEPCMSQQGGKIYVDVDKFHNILPPHDNSIHRYSTYNGGYNHMMTQSLSYLPAFFRPPAPLGRNSDHNSGRSSSSPMPPSGRNRNRKTPSFFGRSRNKL